MEELERARDGSPQSRSDGERKREGGVSERACSSEDPSASMLQWSWLHACIPRQLACIFCIRSGRILMPNKPALALMREREAAAGEAAAASACLLSKPV
jgi:hypothetical protein